MAWAPFGRGAQARAWLAVMAGEETLADQKIFCFNFKV